MIKLFSSLFFWIVMAAASGGGAYLVIGYWPFNWGGRGFVIFLLMLLFLVSGFILLTFAARGTTKLPGRGRLH